MTKRKFRDADVTIAGIQWFDSGEFPALEIINEWYEDQLLPMFLHRDIARARTASPRLGRLGSNGRKAWITRVVGPETGTIIGSDPLEIRYA